MGTVGGGSRTSVVALSWKGEGALMPICSRQMKSIGVTLPSLLEMPSLMAVMSFLRWPLERAVHGDECVVSVGSGEDMEFCDCSANSSKASGSVKAKVGRVDGKGEGGSAAVSELSLRVTGLGSGTGPGMVVLVLHWLSGPKSVVQRLHWERCHDD